MTVRGMHAWGRCAVATWAIALGTSAAMAQGASAPSASVPPEAARLPVEHFARLPMLADVELSPDGQRLAVMLNDGDRTLLMARGVTGQALKGLLTTDNEAFRIRWARWVGNDRLVFSVAFAGRRQFVATHESRLMSIRSDGTGLVNLVQPDSQGGLTGSRTTQQIQDRVVDWMPRDGRHILLELSAPGGGLPAVYRVDVETGERRMVKTPERNVHGWIADAQHRVRVGLRTDGRDTEVRVSDPDGSRWRTAWKWSAGDGGVAPLGFGLDPQTLYVLADHEGRRALFSVRLDDPDLKRTLLLSDRHHDVDGSLIRSPKTGEAIGLWSSSGDGQGPEDTRAEMWDATWKVQLRAIDAALPGMDNRLLQMSADEQRYLVHSSANGKPGRFYLGDRRTGDLSELGSSYPELDTVALRGKQIISLKARDGLNLKAFLSLPAGRALGDGGSPLSMVLLPHGGPHGRDDLGFDPWTEFLVNCGHAVLQVNFRGSDGYGHAFLAAGLRRWGLEMQDDLTDAVDWAVAQRVADRGRICIVGASYGGYAALMGAVKTPEAYRCAISLNGVSDLPDLVQSMSDYVLGSERAELSLGKAWGDRERLRATSPARHADRIQAPVLLVHASGDRVVPIEQSETMAQALKRAGKPYRYVELDQGDHSLSRQAHRVRFFTEMERFLDEHLVPR